MEEENDRNVPVCVPLISQLNAEADGEPFLRSRMDFAGRMVTRQHSITLPEWRGGVSGECRGGGWVTTVTAGLLNKSAR